MLQSKKAAAKIDCAARGNCYSRSRTNSKPTKTKALSTLYDDPKAPRSIFSEENPDFWIPTSPSVSVKKWGTGQGTSPWERPGGTESDLRIILDLNQHGFTEGGCCKIASLKPER
jgi:hypothetical protein